MKRIAIILMCLIFSSCAASASDVETWHDPSFKVNEQKKMFIMPPETSLKAGNGLAPEKRLNSQIMDWIMDSVRKGLKRRGTTIIKPLDALLGDMEFIYSNVNPSSEEFFKHASDMGYTAFIRTAIWQEFKIEHVPEEIRTYTVYREVERRDYKGRLIEVIKIPEEKTEIIPAHDDTYLYTVCQPEIFSVEEYNGDYKAIVIHSIYREYQGGDVMGVVENIIKASMKELFDQPDPNAKKTRPISPPDSRK